MDWGVIAVNVGVLLVGLLGGRWTRQSAKESNAGQLYSGLSASQTAELIRLNARVEALEEDRAESDRDRAEARRLNRVHMQWDWVLIRRLRAALPDEQFPDPPPLDT